jgi:SAM-dependent methyltransferase
VLDVGCGTGQMLHRARLRGYTGRLAGIDPAVAALRCARRRGDIEWAEGTAADIAWHREFDLATMVSHAFQCLLTDDDIRASLTAIHSALRDGGRFAFETRHSQAQAREHWAVGDSGEIAFPDGRTLRMSYRIEVRGEIVDMVEATSLAAGTVEREDAGSLRFLSPETINTLLAETGFGIEAQSGDWDGGPITEQGKEIITMAGA